MASTKPLPDICLESLSQTLRPELFKALSDPMRLAIVASLATRREAATVSDVSQCCGIDFSGVSRHLKLLRDANVVTAQKQGREVLYTLNAEILAGSLRRIAEALEMCRETVK